jgi:hypothetical protein
MLNDHMLLLLARERQEQVRCEVAHFRCVAKTLTRAALLTAFFTTTIAVAYSGDRSGTFSGVVLDGRNRPVSGAAVFLTAVARRCMAKTDHAGRFAISCAGGGGYTGRVHKDGFVDSVLPNVGAISGAAVDTGVVPLRRRASHQPWLRGD